MTLDPDFQPIFPKLFELPAALMQVIKNGGHSPHSESSSAADFNRM